MSEQFSSGIARRAVSLATAGAFVFGGMFMLAPTASADDLDRTPAEVIEQIEARAWPEWSVDNPGPNVDIQAAQYFMNELEVVTDRPGCLFTEEVEATVTEFQVKAETIPVSGALDEKTWVKMRNMLFPTEEDGLMPGDQGPAVIAAQTLLNAKYDAGLDVDGFYGPETEAAVEQVQVDAGIGDDGIYGRLTFKETITKQVENGCVSIPELTERPVEAPVEETVPEAPAAVDEPVEAPAQEVVPEAPAEEVAPEAPAQETVPEAPAAVDQPMDAPAEEVEGARG
ncbi:peptidoglycan-binding domain-containing protein [Nocardiopsis alba]|uniref:peptidoglycan-binding domain-containing protein n=1 Tax=Nocardiopsis alba TaxID=53437 RepID=UPI0033BC715C